MTFFVSSQQKTIIFLQPSVGIFLLGAAAATAGIADIATAAALVVILFVLLELILAGCRTEISSYTFNF
jgi:hypothetical protein